MNDHMELGESGVVPVDGKWFYDKHKQERFFYDENGERRTEENGLLDDEDSDDYEDM